MSEKRKANNPKGCETCSECVYVCEGDSICSADAEPKLIMNGFVLSDDYFWCGGEKWERE